VRRASQFARRFRDRAHYPGMGKALYIQSVADAASVAGGYERLAAELGVGTDEVERWSTGTSIPECAVLLRIIEIALNPRVMQFSQERAEPRGTGALQGAE
jgi:hypothetical protein